MHPILLSAMRNRSLTEAARSVLSYLYANTNGSLSSEVFIDEICDDLGIADSTLRRHRKDLADAGYLTSRRDGDRLTFDLHDPERSPSERCVDENAHRLSAERAPSERSADHNAHLLSADRAPSERSADDRSPTERAPSERSAQNAHLLSAERAPSERSAKRAERENEPPPPHTPQQGKFKYAAGGGSTTTTTGGCAEGGADGDANTERACGLLVAVGVWPETARRLAVQHGLEAIARHVADWQIAKQRKPLGVPVLVSRIDRGGAPPAVAEADMRAGALGDHITQDDLFQWRIAKNPLAGYDVPAGFRIGASGALERA